MRFLILIFCCFSVNNALSQLERDIIISVETDSVVIELPDSLRQAGTVEPVGQVRESRRIVAVLLCITLGPFGMHRLYLGTEPQVAAAYTLTLGGGLGFVTVIDLLHLVFSRDISRFRNNPHFIMWGNN